MKKRLIIIISSIIIISILFTGGVILYSHYGNSAYLYGNTSTEKLIYRYWSNLNYQNINGACRCFPKEFNKTTSDFTGFSDELLNETRTSYERTKLDFDTTLKIKKIKDLSVDVYKERYNLSNFNEISMYESSCGYNHYGNKEVHTTIYMTFIIGKIDNRYYIIDIIDGIIIDDDITIAGSTDAISD